MYKFVAYNNAIPIAISIVLLGAGGVFAATDPEAIYTSQQQIVSIDNTYLANKDLSAYSPRVEITGVTEDGEYYYVGYNFSTIDLQDGAWRDVIKLEVMKVSKVDLGQYRDLGLYVTEQLKQRTERELAYLKEVQGIEKKNVTNKIVATQYGGLVGKLLDTKTEELPGYTPVVTPPPAPTVAASTGQGSSAQSQAGTQTQTASSGNPSLTIQVLGNNPAQIAQRSSYADLGAVASDNHNSNIRIETYLDGKKVSQVQIDTAATSTHTVRYVALDPQDNTVSAERTVIVYDPAIGPPVPQSQVQNGTTSNAPATTNSSTSGTTNTSTQTTTTGTSDTGSTSSGSGTSGSSDSSSTSSTTTATSTTQTTSATTTTATTTQTTSATTSQQTSSSSPATSTAATSTPAAETSSTATTTSSTSSGGTSSATTTATSTTEVATSTSQ